MTDTSQAAPRTSYEDEILAIWRDVLGRSDIDVSDDFFAVGDHTLAPTVVARIRKSLGVDIPVMDFFESRTVTALASAVAARSSATHLTVPRRPPDAEPVLSFDQQRIWMETQLLPDGAYNNHARRRLVGVLDVAAMERSVRAIIGRHEALRSRFPTVADKPVPVVDDPDDNWHLRVKDVSAVSDVSDVHNDREGAALRLLDEDATTRFDLDTGPLFRCLLIKLSDTEHILGLTLHQIISDSRSIYAFERELAALYQAGGDLDRAGLPALSIQYRDFAVWQRGRLVGEVLERQVGYWRRHLAGAPPVLALPTAQRRTADQGAESERVSCALSGDEAAALRDLCRAHDVTPFMALLAGLATVLGRWSSQSDVVIGVAFEGRADSEVDKLMGIFFNVLPFRTDLSGNPTFVELLGRVRRVALDGYAHAEAPIDVVIGDLQVPRDPRRTPIFEVVLNVTAPPETERVAGLAVESMGTSTPRTRFDLFINAQETSGGVPLTFDFAPARFDAAMMQTLAEHLRTLLCGAIEDPTKGILDYSLGSTSDAAGSDSSPAHRLEAAPHAAGGARHAAQLPDRTAVIDALRSLGVGAVLDVSPTGAPAEGTIDLSALPPASAAPHDWAVDRFDLTKDDRFAVLSTVDGNLASALCSALCAGATLVIPDRSVTGDIGTLTTWLRANEISVLYVNPSIVRGLAAQDPCPQLPALKCVFIDNAGEFIPHDVVALRAMSATCRCVGVYRVDPGGQPLAMYEVPDDWQVRTAPLRVPLGTELPDCPARLLGPSGQPVAIGEVGEIWFGSFRTGDIGRRWPDGSLEYVSRVGADPTFDPLETVATLRDVPEVRDAVVTEHIRPDDRTMLHGYVASADPRLDTVGVHNFLRARLPGYLIPEHIVVLAELPRTPAGDYDLTALPEADADCGAVLDYVAPRTPMERELTDILIELLDIDRVGVHDSFFELGGFSLLATKLTTRIRARFNVELALRDVFDSPTVDELAQLIIRTQAELSGTDELEALLDDIEGSDDANPSTLYERAVARLRESAAFGADKPDETPETSVQALWYAAAGEPRSVAGVSLPLPRLSDGQERALDDLLARRIAGEPLAYLTGRGHFLGLELLTEPGALIPRRETELLGGAVLKLAKEIAAANSAVRILDLGTGTGNLAVGLAVREPRAHVWASDVEAEAVAVAKRNAAFHDVTDRVTVVQSDLFEGLDTLSPFDLVVCNPPYMPSDKARNLPVEVGGFEPAAAFDGGDVGLSVLYRLIAEAPRHVVPGGWVCFELGAGMGRVVEKRLAGLRTYGEIRMVADGDGITRAILAKTLR